jgi:1,2-diacylglycerol 3-beta-galactosyltransferase
MDMSDLSSSQRLRVLLLFSDTGGGHRSAAEALLEAWETEHPGRVQAEMVDVFRSYTPFPFNRFGTSYPWLVKYCCRGYGAAYRCSDTPRRAQVLARACYGYVRPYLRWLLAEHPADVVVSVHPLFNHCINWALGERGLHVPYITVVTDLFTAHAFWFYPHVTQVIVPTEGARQRALQCGVPAERVRVRGLPVAGSFAAALRHLPPKPVERESLGLSPHGRVVLLAGGGDGMGPLYRTARALNASLSSLDPPPQLAIITGRNVRLRRRLRAEPWDLPVRVEGFVRNMPEWMSAADVLVTKAGPGTITEALLSGLPLLLVSRVPGQEDGNIDYVVRSGAGTWEPNPTRAAERLREWLTPGNPQLTEMAGRARQLAEPEAASAIATDILALAGEKKLRPAPV